MFQNRQRILLSLKTFLNVILDLLGLLAHYSFLEKKKNAKNKIL